MGSKGSTGGARAWLRLGALWEYLRASLWALPGLFVLTSLVAGSALVRWDPQLPPVVEPWIFGGTPDGARSLLSAVAGAMITVTALTFSLTIIALQMASTQFSPRVLRRFLTDRGNQIVLGLFLATFAYAITVLRVIRGEEQGVEEVVPQLAVSVGVGLTLASIGALVYFIHHLAKKLQAQNILQEITREALKLVDEIYGESLKGDPSPLPTDVPDEIQALPAQRSGYLQAVDIHRLADQAREHGAVVRLRPPVGAYVAAGSTLAWSWNADGAGPAGPDGDLRAVVAEHVQIGSERTMQQDVSFAVRQLVDIGVKALSSGLNDPTTAVDTLGHLSAVLCRIATRRLGPLAIADDANQVRAVIPRPDFAGYVHLCCDQIRRYGASEPAVLRGIIAMLTDVAEVISTAEQRMAIRGQLQRTTDVAERSLDASDASIVRSAASQAEQALRHGRRPDSAVLAQ